MKAAGKSVGRIPGRLVIIINSLVGTDLGMAFFFLSVFRVGVVITVAVIKLEEL